MKEKNYIMLKYFDYVSQFPHSFDILRPMQEIERSVKKRFISPESALGLFVSEICKKHSPFENEEDETKWYISLAKEGIKKTDIKESSDKLVKAIIALETHPLESKKES